MTFLSTICHVCYPSLCAIRVWQIFMLKRMYLFNIFLLVKSSDTWTSNLNIEGKRAYHYATTHHSWFDHFLLFWLTERIFASLKDKLSWSFIEIWTHLLVNILPTCQLPPSSPPLSIVNITISLLLPPPTVTLWLTRYHPFYLT